MLGCLVLCSALPARGQTIDNNLTLPKLGPKPPTSGNITATPFTIIPAQATPYPVRPTEQQIPTEAVAHTNFVPSAVTTQPLAAPATGSAAWEKLPAVKTPIFTLAPTNPWQQSPKSPLSLDTPPPSVWDAKPGKGPWK